MKMEEESVNKILESVNLLVVALPPVFSEKEQSILKDNKIPLWFLEHPFVAGAIKVLLDMGEEDINRFLIRLIDDHILASKKRFPDLTFSRRTIVEKFSKEVSLLRMIGLARTNSQYKQKFDEAIEGVRGIAP
jgi:hypothetical protein